MVFNLRLKFFELFGPGGGVPFGLISAQKVLEPPGSLAPSQPELGGEPLQWKNIGWRGKIWAEVDSKSEVFKTRRPILSCPVLHSGRHIPYLHPYKHMVPEVPPTQDQASLIRLEALHIS